jgi:hypothetical protein
MGDHADHIHVGFSPSAFGGGPEEQFVQLLKPDQWLRLTDRLGDIDNPDVPTSPSEYSLPADEAKGGDGDASGGSGGTSSGD